MKDGVALVIPEVNPQDALMRQGHHRQPELLDDADGDGAEAAARCRPREASDRQHVPGRQRRRRCRDTTIWSKGRKRTSPGSDYKYTAFKHPIAFNAIPQIGGDKEEGYTSEEMKMVYETRKIMGDQYDPDLPDVRAHSGRQLPQRNDLGRNRTPVSPEEARELFRAFPGLKVVDDLTSAQYPMPSTCDGSRPRLHRPNSQDLSHPNGLTFWCVSDNLRKGAATNAVQIAELLAKHRFAG